MNKPDNEIDFHPTITVIIKRYDSEGNTYIEEHQLEEAKVYEADTIDDEKIIFVVGRWGSTSSKVIKMNRND